MRRIPPQLCFIALLSCVNHEFLPGDPMIIACAKCGKPRSEMQWLATLIESVKTDATQVGDIYAVPYNRNTIFFHQPLMMSFYGYLIYDCDGNRIDDSTIDARKFGESMKHAILIYSSSPD